MKNNKNKIFQIDLIEFRCVSKNEIEEVAKNYGVHLFECSAKTGVNIEKIFETVGRDIVNVRKNRPKKDKKSFCILI